MVVMFEFIAFWTVTENMVIWYLVAAKKTSLSSKMGIDNASEISERIVDEFDDFFIMATDGVWDVVDNNYAVQIIHSFIAKSSNWSTFEAANAICRYARSRWEKLSPMIDDITCIVVKIHR